MKSAYTKYISGLILFGLNGIVSSKILMSSYEIVFFRTLIGSVFLTVVYCMCVRRKKTKGTMPGDINGDRDEDCEISGHSGNLTMIKKEMLFVILSGVVMGLSWIFLYEAYVRIGVGLSSITYYCGPVIVMLSAPLVFHKKLTISQYLCFVIVFAGIMLVSLPGVLGHGAVDINWALVWICIGGISCIDGHIHDESSTHHRREEFHDTVGSELGDGGVVSFCRKNFITS